MKDWLTENTPQIKRWTYQAGFAGVSFIALGMLLPALAYTGRVGEPYSLANHFISELGEVAHSELAWVFNLGLIIGGLLLTVFMLGTAVQMQHWLGWVFGAAGVVSGLAGTGVGFFPMDNLGPHLTVAMAFFNLGMAAAVLFTFFVLTAGRRRFPAWLALPGLLAGASFFTLLYGMEPLLPEGAPIEAVIPLLENRPAVWPLAVVEWVVGISVLVWVAVVSYYFWHSRDS
jgi:hypothetical membrane protein